MITKQNLVRNELIGLSVQIVDSKNKTLIGLKGKIIDERKNILLIRSKDVEKKVIKDTSTFMFTLPSKKKVKIKGELLIGAPWDRLKKKLKVKTRWQKK
jgi:ribonuclease P protein subunit POP4